MPVATSSPDSHTTRSGCFANRVDFESMSAQAIMEWANCRFDNELAITTSFGIQSAVMLHMSSRIRPNIPVVWVDTGFLPKETYWYAEQLTDLLGLNLHVYQADLSPARMETLYGRLWESDRVEDLNEYDRIRKVEPLQKAFRDLQPTGWISGLRSEQTNFRSQLERVWHDGERTRIHPILNWSQKDTYGYMQRYDLPQHPLWHDGYTSVGDEHSSRALSSSDGHDRATRFNGLKEECGIHTTLTAN